MCPCAHGLTPSLPSMRPCSEDLDFELADMELSAGEEDEEAAFLTRSRSRCCAGRGKGLP